MLVLRVRTKRDCSESTVYLKIGAVSGNRGSHRKLPAWPVAN